MEWYEVTKQKPPKVMDVLNPFIETENPDNNNNHQRRNHPQDLNTDLKRRIEFVLSSSDYYNNNYNNNNIKNDNYYTHQKIHPSFPYHEASIPDQHYYSTEDYFFYPRNKQNDDCTNHTNNNNNPSQEHIIQTSLTPSLTWLISLSLLHSLE